MALGAPNILTGLTMPARLRKKDFLVNCVSLNFEHVTAHGVRLQFIGEK